MYASTANFPARSHRHANHYFGRMNADNFSCIFGFQKLFMGEVLFIPWGGDYVLGITGLLAISIRVTWFINGGQLAHPTRYEINPTPALPLERGGSKSVFGSSTANFPDSVSPPREPFFWPSGGGILGVDWAGRPIEPGRAMDGPSWRPAKSRRREGIFAQQKPTSRVAFLLVTFLWPHKEK